jgi:hypothetical protein
MKEMLVNKLIKTKILLIMQTQVMDKYNNNVNSLHYKSFYHNHISEYLEGIKILVMKT